MNEVNGTASQTSILIYRNKSHVISCN